MGKRNKGTHGIYELTCISDKCSRRFKVLWELRDCVEIGIMGRKRKTGYWTLEEAKMGVLAYPFNGCPFCGTWWCTGPLDAAAYPTNTASVKWTKAQVARRLRNIWDGKAGSDDAGGYNF